MSVVVIEGMDGVAAAAWDALAGADDPFVEHAFLAHLERSGSVGKRAGQVPRHLIVERDGVVVGAAPLYLKRHSQGEYIFDWGWADAAQRAGIPYYPKLVCAVPFTPATGPRLLVHPDADAASVRAELAAAAWALAGEVGAHSVHWLFVPEGEVGALVDAGYAARRSWQYHFTNPGYRDFDDLLDQMTGRRRKEIRRERRLARESGLELAVEPAHTLSAADLDALHRCYLSTIDAHGAIPYLTPAWWAGLGSVLGHRAWVATARRDGALVAGALAFQKGGHLFGRYWGALEELGMVHFELCYYQLLEHAIRVGLRRVEAGAQGEHKIPRGFLPSLTWSAHRLRHPGLDAAVREFLEREAAHVGSVVDQLGGRSPFRVAAGEEG
jgi:predicted N-acyltransferase